MTPPASPAARKIAGHLEQHHARLVLLETRVDSGDERVDAVADELRGLRADLRALQASVDSIGADLRDVLRHERDHVGGKPSSGVLDAVWLNVARWSAPIAIALLVAIAAELARSCGVDVPATAAPIHSASPAR